MPTSWGEDEQRFAAAVEAVSTRGLPLNSALRRDLQVVTLLRESREALSPDAATSGRMKARLFAEIDPSSADRGGSVAVAVEPEQRTERVLQLAATGGAGAGGRHRRHEAGSRPSTVRRATAQRALRPRGRFAVVSAAATLFLVALASAGVFLSGDALPGDSLYGVKRTTENVGLGLTFDAADKAQRHLELAQTRLSEVSALLTDPEKVAEAPALVDQTLKSFNAETASASQLLLGDARTVGEAQLGTLRNWATSQMSELGNLRTTLPAPSVKGATDSLTLLDRLSGRTDALQGRLGCRELTSGRSDELGLLPAGGLCTPIPEGADPSQERTVGNAPNGIDPGSLGLPNPGLLAPGGPTTGSGSNPSASAGPGLQIPLGGVAPITLPPLLPGLAPITIGG